MFPDTLKSHQTSERLVGRMTAACNVLAQRPGNAFWQRELLLCWRALEQRDGMVDLLLDTVSAQENEIEALKAIIATDSDECTCTPRSDCPVCARAQTSEIPY